MKILLALVVVLATATVAGADPKQGAERPAPAAPAKATRISIAIDAQEMSLAVPPHRPAFIDDSRWTHRLAIVATEPSDNGATLHVAVFPQATERASITNEQVVKEAKLKRKVTKAQSLVIEPGKEVPRDAFGAAPPKAVTIRVVNR